MSLGKIPIHYTTDRPRDAVKLAEKRMDDFVRAFGYVMAHGSAMDLKRFAVSCYLQGCEDMAQAVIDNPEICTPSS